MTDKEPTYIGKNMHYIADKEVSYTGNDALYDSRQGSHLHWEDDV